MTNDKFHFPQLFLRLAISLTILSAVADRFGFWGENSVWGNWENFEKYTKQLAFLLPETLGTFSAFAATFFEILFPLMLIFGFKTKIAAFGTGVLLMVFGLSMTIALGIKAPFDYSVWVGSAAAFLLAIQEKFSLSFDELLRKDN